MRPRLALLVIAAVIFAPGWYGQGQMEPPQGADLAARVLAPTFNEGIVRDRAAGVTHQLTGRDTKRVHPIDPLAGLAPFLVATFGPAVMWLISSDLIGLTRRVRRSRRLSRAPPLLQPA